MRPKAYVLRLIFVCVCGLLPQSSFAVDPVIGAEWSGDPRWLWGRSWSVDPSTGAGETFFGSIGKGKSFFGSSISGAQYKRVEIRFNTDSTFCQTFNRSAGYASNGVGIFPGSAWDISDTLNPRRLNICFVEDPAFAVPNQIWDPNTTSYGKREFIFIMASNYDGTGLTYAGRNIYIEANSLDVMYAWWPRLQYPYTMSQTLPGTLKVFGYELLVVPEQNPNAIMLTWQKIDPAFSVSRYRIYAGVTSPPPLFDSVNGNIMSFAHSGLTIGQLFFYQIEAVNSSGDPIGSSPIIRARAELGLNLVGRWNGRPSYTDIWGYTESSSGKEYAIIGSGGGVSIVDINGAVPFETGFMPSVYSGGVKVYKNYVVTGQDGGPAQIYNISNVNSPVLVSSIPRAAHTVNVYKDYLFLQGASNSALYIYDISNPASPQFVSHYVSFYFHDTDIRNDTLAGAGINGQGVEFVDITDIYNPVRIGGFNYPLSGAHNVEFSADGKYLYVGDETGIDPWTRIFDISDINNVVKLSDIIVDSQATVHNSYLKDSLLYIAHYTEGVRVWNVKDPVNPLEIASYDTYPQAGYGYNGCWTVYPFFASGKIVASDRSTGLYVLRLGDAPLDVDDGDNALPRSFSLEQNYPNPFNPTTTIQFSLQNRSHVTLVVYNTLGQEVTTLVNETRSAGMHTVVWNGKNSGGQTVSSGIYFYQLRTDAGFESKKMILLK
ncbi:MAG: choice-of-anchor B family protein [candidate division Zixibacteria bacterium]|nr:choice-of-anchor B family protein [candidate division Zixibacteria bacterium]